MTLASSVVPLRFINCLVSIFFQEIMIDFKQACHLFIHKYLVLIVAKKYPMAGAYLKYKVFLVCSCQLIQKKAANCRIRWDFLYIIMLHLLCKKMKRFISCRCVWFKNMTQAMFMQ